MKMELKLNSSTNTLRGWLSGTSGEANTSDATHHSLCEHLLWVPAALFLIQSPVNAPAKTTERSKHLGPVIHMGKQDRIPGSQLLSWVKLNSSCCSHLRVEPASERPVIAIQTNQIYFKEFFFLKSFIFFDSNHVPWTFWTRLIPYLCMQGTWA